ncbi:hypothetical protein BURPS406E_H0105 [Burkholderia pseudomallei 406e]|nr:hypothetical protein GBP346_A2985 [Burkholderia pseudomallei MSHR346]EDO84786.1 hypothetical protein BURPS406E_H0105 [Burkholderia pseudomallei 406e]
MVCVVIGDEAPLGGLCSGSASRPPLETLASQAAGRRAERDAARHARSRPAKSRKEFAL